MKYKLPVSILVLSVFLSSCNNNSSVPTQQQTSNIVSSRPDAVIIDDQKYDSKPEGYEEIQGTPGIQKQTFKNLSGVPYQEASFDNLTTQAVTKVRDEWLAKGPWTKVLYGSTERLCNRTIAFNISATGSYSGTVSGSGDIRLIKVNVGVTGSVSLTAGSTYTVSACAYFQKQELLRYVRWEKWAYYSDGTSKWTGGVSNLRAPAQSGDVKDVRVSEYSKG